MTVCGNKLGGVCGACTLVNICRNNEIANLPKSNIEWMREASLDELAELITDIVYECRDCDDCMDCRLGWCSKDYVAEWLKQPHQGGES